MSFSDLLVDSQIFQFSEAPLFLGCMQNNTFQPLQVVILYVTGHVIPALDLRSVNGEGEVRFET